MLDGFKKVLNEKVEEGTRGAIEKLSSDFAQVAKSSYLQQGSNYAYEQGYNDGRSGVCISIPPLFGIDPEKILEIKGYYMKGYNDAKRDIVKEDGKRKLQGQILKSVTVGAVVFTAGLLIGIFISRNKN